MTNVQTVDIAKCPLCGKAHKYRVKIETVVIASFVGSGKDKPTPQRVRVVAPCPEKDKDNDFMVTLSFTESAPILNVTLTPI